ncbi:putative pectinesterase/pectinesterase inhibitor 28 [Euphorbia lathyris]|uniref:putative pectinesterase/pectinesterase inhibitor 28 n=1 Tax=Euphorbia lathyris TaxID=212925 RepID=UPI003313B3A7
MAYGNEDGAAKKKKIAVIGVSSLILVAMVVAVTVGVNQDKGSGSSGELGSAPHISTSKKSIQSICQPTDYKQTCEQSLTKVAGNATSPNQLVMAGFEAAIKALEKAIENSTTVRDAAKDPMSKQALANCKILMKTAIKDLRVSIKQVGDFDLTKLDELLDNLKIWLSATITYQQTCINGFDNTTGKAGEKMKGILLTSSQLSSNGLAMVAGLSSVLGDFNLSIITGRKLLSTNMAAEPMWLSPARKRLLAATPATIKPDITVAQDGSGQFKTIDEAIKKIPDFRTKPFVVYVKAGVYKEKITFKRAATHVMLIGDGPTKTKITGNASFASGVSPIMTATVSVSGSHFIAKDIGFENTAGAIGHQAIALKVQSDMSIFYNCHINGYQNSLFAHTYRQFYRDTTISGTIDTVFGDTAAVFQNCKFVIRKPIDLQKCTITAQGRNDTRQTTGFIIQNSTITAEKDYLAVKETNPAFLGRPRNPYSRTIFMHTNIENVINPKRWSPWMGTYGTETCFYAEYENKGTGADTSKSVTWKGVKKITAQKAAEFSAAKFIDGDSWITSSRVPYSFCI